MLPRRVMGWRLPLVWSPQFVILGEAGLDGVRGELGVDVGAGAAAVAGVFAHDFTEEL